MSQLPNAPLQEVIFEIRWTFIPNSPLGHIVDEGYELASGRLNSLVENEFPFYKRIVPNGVPEQLLPYQVVHQFWAGENQWPVLQLGPGIFTINCTDEKYDWNENFKPLIKKGIDWLLQAYKIDLNIRFASLRYIDAIKVDDYGGIPGGWSEFISTQFNIAYENKFDPRGREKQVQILQTFALENGSDLQLQISDGTKNNETALVWQTSVMKQDTFNREKVIDWAEYAHEITHDLFKEMIKPELYGSFGK